MRRHKIIFVIFFTIIVVIVNFKYYIQDKFWISYFGKPYDMTIIKIDSFRLQKKGYDYIHNLGYSNTHLKPQRNIELIYGNGKHSLGKKINVQVYNNKATFSKKPNSIFVLILGSPMILSGFLIYGFFFKKMGRK